MTRKRSGARSGARPDGRTPPDHGRLPPDNRGFAQLQQGLTGERALIGESYMDDSRMLKAYLDYYWPVSRAQAAHALSFASDIREIRREIRRVIDVGSGPGPVAAAFIDRGAREVVLIDQSRRALDLALRELPKRTSGSASLCALEADIAVPDPSLIPLWGKADFVSFGHSLNELWSAAPDRVERRATLLERYAQALAPGGVLLVIEPALLSTSRDLLAVRNLLVARRWRVLAPCCGRESLPCPALEAGDQQTCHEEIVWTPPPEVAALARSLKLDKDSLKMTWFLLAPPGSDNESLSPSASGASSAVVYRVVSDPMLNKGGRVRRLICGPSGRFPLSVAQGSADETRTGFDRLKRGDAVSIDAPEQRENGWGISNETVIRSYD